MADTKSIPPADLLIDAENPRLVQPNSGQRDAQRETAQHQGKKLIALASDILIHGVNPSELPIVTPLKDDLGRYAVLEGNRRLSALKALENPEWLVGAVDGSVVDAMRRLSKKYQKNPVESVQCLVVKSREEAEHWIALKHTGENDGAGVVRWGSDEMTRFSARTKGQRLGIQSQALNFLENRGDLTPQQRSKVPAASYRRLLSTPEVRAKVGIDIKNGVMVLVGEENAVAKALLYVANDLESGRTKTKDIYTLEQRIAYANKLPPDIVVRAVRSAGRGKAPGSGAGLRPKRPAKPTVRRVRDCLIPVDCILNISDPRTRDIESELRQLSLDSYPCAFCKGGSVDCDFCA
jgi:hypothetical protein